MIHVFYILNTCFEPIVNILETFWECIVGKNLKFSDFFAAPLRSVLLERILYVIKCYKMQKQIEGFACNKNSFPFPDPDALRQDVL